MTAFWTLAFRLTDKAISASIAAGFPDPADFSNPFAANTRGQCSWNRSRW